MAVIALSTRSSGQFSASFEGCRISGGAGERMNFPDMPIRRDERCLLFSAPLRGCLYR